MSKLIDLIIPFKYIPKDRFLKLIDNISSQTMISDMIVSFIDDNSPNFKSLVKYIPDSITFRVITHTVTKGPGISRAEAVDSTLSPYISFLDADDLLYSSTSIEEFYNGIQGYDGCFGGVASFNGDEFDERHSYYLDPENPEVPVFLHSNMFRTKFLVDEGINFTSHNYNEDHIFYNKLCICPNFRFNVISGFQYSYYHLFPGSLTSADISHINVHFNFMCALYAVFKFIRDKQYDFFDLFEHNTIASGMLKQFIMVEIPSHFKGFTREDIKESVFIMLLFARRVEEIFPGEFSSYLSFKNYISNAAVLSFIRGETDHIYYNNLWIELSAIIAFLKNFAESAKMVDKSTLNEILGG